MAEEVKRQETMSLSATTNLKKVLLLWLVGAAFFMESLDTTILNAAVPTVAVALKVAPLSMKSVLSSYTLSLAVFIPVSAGWRIALVHAVCSRRLLAFLRSDLYCAG
jgi:MFS family permease